jgi:prepilin-type N-terminal cleavage/methylation domain-containing protein
MKRHEEIRDGFSLSEILIVVAIVGILSGVTIAFTNLELQRSRINSVQVSLAGWLQVAQRSALLNKSADTESGGCTVVFNAASGQKNGDIVASVTPSSCAPNSEFKIEVSNLGNTTISTSPAANVSFTPRGTAIYPGSAQDFQLLITLSNSSLLRCIRLSGLAGVVELGSGTGTTCTDYSRL